MKRTVIDKGLIGEVLRIYHLFNTGGYHVVSSIRMIAGARATRVTGISQDRPIPRVNNSPVRQFTSEAWSMGLIDFENNALAVTAYSPLYHARAIGRKNGDPFPGGRHDRIHRGRRSTHDDGGTAPERGQGNRLPDPDDHQDPG